MEWYIIASIIGLVIGIIIIILKRRNGDEGGSVRKFIDACCRKF